METAGSIRKAIIMARGLGTRMRRADAQATLSADQSAVADSGVKAMIPVGRPFLDFVLSGLADAGFSEVCLIVAPEHGIIRDHYAALAPKRISIHFAIQPEARGTADAVLAAQPFAGTDDFIVMNSDNYYPQDVLRSLQELGQPGVVLFEEAALLRNSNIPKDRTKAFGYCLVSKAGFLEELIEKPNEAEAASVHSAGLVSMNIWRFSSQIFDYCRTVPLSARGEFELPQAVRQGIHSGMKLKVVLSRSGVLDLSQRGDIASVTQRLEDVSVSL
jgi:glucose-1-phosphate thymidylyltransferase